MDLASAYIAFAVAYLIGSVSFAVVVSKLMRLPDPRTYGSNNPGATNVLRSGNKVAAVLTLIGDALKGFFPTYLMGQYAFDLGFVEPATAETVIAFVGVAAFLGHLFPVFHRFQGGKGVATALGALLGYDVLLGLLTLVVWLIIAAVFRYSSLAAIVAAVFAPFFAWQIFERPVLAMAVASMSVLLVWRHWRNIMKLLTGKESKLGEKPDPRKQRRRRRRQPRVTYSEMAPRSEQDFPSTQPEQRP